MFAKGFWKTTRKRKGPHDDRYVDSDLDAMYPSPRKPENVSGSEKVAADLPLPQVPPKPLKGLQGGARPMSKPSRITTEMGAYGAPKGAVGVTGVSATKPFAKSISKFGKKPRMGLRFALKKGFL